MKDLEDKEVRILNCILECSGSMSTSLAGAENTETEENGREKKKKKKKMGESPCLQPSHSSSPWFICLLLLSLSGLESVQRQGTTTIC